MIRIPGQKPLLGQPLNYSRPTARSMVGAWLFTNRPNPLGRTLDISANANHGTLVGDVHSVPGKFGNALDFPADGWVDCGTSSILDMGTTGDLSVVVWLKPNAAWGITRVLRKTKALGSANLYQLNGGTTEVQYSANSSGGSTAEIALPAIGEWHQLVGITRGPVDEIWHNRIKGTDGTRGTRATGTGPFYIGQMHSGLFEFNGQIDHVLIYNRALSAGEVLSLYADPFQDWRPEPIELFSDKTAAGVTVPVMTYHYKQAGGL